MIRGNLKKLVPKVLKPHLHKILKYINRTVGVKLVAKRLDKKKKAIYCKVKKKKPVKVVFLALHQSIWKVDPLFLKMQEDPFFEPIIFVCPFVAHGDVEMWRELSLSIEYFKAKGYDVVSSYNFESNKWRDLSDVDPDLVFFTNSYGLTKKSYYNDVYLNYLTAYVPYYFMATNHAGELKEEINKEIFHYLWRFYCPHDLIYESFNKNVNHKLGKAVLTGYPAMESLVKPSNSEVKGAWKNKHSNKIKIIYAPHHTVNKSNLSLSTFLIFGEFMRELALLYKDEVEWAFKPHPLLRKKLYDNEEWGVSKTDEYYSFWRNNSFSQLDDGEYEKLFVQSDAIIHDCSSFIVEYAFLRKPSLYLLKNKEAQYLNDFGRKVFDSYEVASSKSKIIEFVDALIAKPEKNRRARKNPFLDRHIDKFYKKKLPSKKIIDDLKMEFIKDRDFLDGQN